MTERRQAARAGLMLDPDGQRLYEVFSALLQLVDKAHNQAAYTAKVYEERGHGDELVQQMDTLRMLHDAVQLLGLTNPGQL